MSPLLEKIFMYGILKDITNTGASNELAAVFMTPLSIRSNTPGYSGDTVGLKRVVSTSNIQRWEIEAELAPDFNEDSSFFINNVVNNFSKKIYVRMPQPFRSRHGKNDKSALTPVGAPMSFSPILLLTQEQTPGTSTMTVSGLGPYNLGVGEFIQFEGFSKVYMITDPGTNGTSFEIFPSLRSTVPVNTKILYGDKVTMHGYYEPDNAFGITYYNGILTQPGKFTIIEAI
jgi:hypothetical protein